MSRLTVIVIIVLLAAGMPLVVGCGEDDAAGTYKWSSGELTMLRDLTLILEEDGTFSLTGTSSLFDEEWDVHGTWTQEDATVRLIATEGDESATEIATYRDGLLSWEGVVWEKQ